MTTTNEITSIITLRAGETPTQYSESPGDLPGPWGASPEAAIATYEQQTGERVAQHWLRGDALWIVSVGV